MRGLSVGWFVLGVFSLPVLTIAAEARADAAGDKVLAGMDVAMNRFKSQSLEYEVVNQEPGKSERKLGISIKLKGEKRLSEFTAPADMKGTKVLILSATQMYVFLPSFGKVRRIASHVTDQGFMGLAFSQTDMSTTRYSDAYTGQLASEDATSWKVVATPKAGQQTPYAKIEFTVAKDKNLPTELKYYSADGAHVKTETRSAYSCEGQVCTPGEHKMVIHKDGHWTKLIRKSWKVNQEISDDVFSKRSLEK